jgi:hypothetical protein
MGLRCDIASPLLCTLTCPAGHVAVLWFAGSPEPYVVVTCCCSLGSDAEIAAAVYAGKECLVAGWLGGGAAGGDAGEGRWTLGALQMPLRVFTGVEEGSVKGTHCKSHCEPTSADQAFTIVWGRS